MSDPISISSEVKNWAEAAAIVIGGGWALWRFILKREREAAQHIDLTYKCSLSTGNQCLVVFDVVFTNKGSVRLMAKRKRKPAYCVGETLQYSGDFLLRRIPTNWPQNETITWFAKGWEESPQSTDIEVDLLNDCEEMGETDFWMEPGEVSHSGFALRLEKGSYLAMITFVGDRGDHEFWRRIIPIEVS